MTKVVKIVRETGLRMVHTNVLLTVNTNKRFLPDDPRIADYEDRLEMVLDAVVTRENLGKYITFNDKENRGWAYNEYWFPSVLIKYKSELGPQTGCLHYHCGVFISHYTRLKFDTVTLRDDVQNMALELGLGKLYFMAAFGRTARDNVETMLEYIYKSTLPPIDENQQDFTEIEEFVREFNRQNQIQN
jgi:hypothetical protein